MNENNVDSDVRIFDFDVRLEYPDGTEEIKTFSSDFPRWEILKLQREYEGIARVSPVQPWHKV